MGPRAAKRKATEGDEEQAKLRVVETVKRVTRSMTKQPDGTTQPNKEKPKPKAKAKPKPASKRKKKSVEEEDAKAAGPLEELTAVDGGSHNKIVVVEHCKQCNLFKTRAFQVKDGLEKGVPGVKVLLNPEEFNISNKSELQGKRDTYYVSDLMAFELTERNSSYSMALICKHFANTNTSPAFPYVKSLFPFQLYNGNKNLNQLGEHPGVEFPDLRTLDSYLKHWGTHEVIQSKMLYTWVNEEGVAVCTRTLNSMLMLLLSLTRTMVINNLYQAMG